MLHHNTATYRDTGDLAAREALLTQLYRMVQCRRAAEVALDAYVDLVRLVDRLAQRYHGDTESQAVAYWSTCITWCIRHRVEHMMQPKRCAPLVSIDTLDESAHGDALYHSPHEAHDETIAHSQQLQQIAASVAHLPHVAQTLECALSHGDTLEATAAQRGVSTTTVHAHMRAIATRVRGLQMTPSWRSDHE